MMPADVTLLEWPLPVTLTEDEIDELHKFTVQAYLDPNRWPHLRKLLDRVDMHRWLRDKVTT
jgi:hypothetical protein